MKLHMHNHIMVIYIQYHFHGIPSIVYKVMTEDEKIKKFRQPKGNNHSKTDAIPMKIHMHNHIMVIYIQCQFHEIPSICYLVMAEDRKNHWNFRQTRGNNSAIPDDSPIRLHVHNLTMVIHVYKISTSFMKFYPLVTELWPRTEKIIEI